MAEIRSYRCWHRLNDPERFASIINAPSAGKARYAYMLEVGDVYPDLKITDVRVRSNGLAHSSEDFRRCARNRGQPDARCGARVKVGDDDGVIVGHNSSANFNVLFESGRYAGQTLNCHPSTIEFRR